uniref:Uncharacterized protein n=1 Tax=Oryza barthii TaxID=65489 RepID=A0A0D3HUA2_9ORYZ
MDELFLKYNQENRFHLYPYVRRRQSPSSPEAARRSRGWRQRARDDFGSAASVKSGSCEMSRSISAACSADAGRTTTGSTGAAEEDADDAAEKADEQ